MDSGAICRGKPGLTSAKAFSQLSGRRERRCRLKGPSSARERCWDSVSGSAAVSRRRPAHGRLPTHGPGRRPSVTSVARRLPGALAHGRSDQRLSRHRAVHCSGRPTVGGLGHRSLSRGRTDPNHASRRCDTERRTRIAASVPRMGNGEPGEVQARLACMTATGMSGQATSRCAQRWRTARPWSASVAPMSMLTRF
jgi:hypothetical protein